MTAAKHLPQVLTPELATVDAYVHYRRGVFEKRLESYRGAIEAVLEAIKTNRAIQLEYWVADGAGEKKDGREPKIVVPYAILVKEVVGSGGVWIESEQRRAPAKAGHGPEVQTLVHQLEGSVSRTKPETFDWKTLALRCIENPILVDLPEGYIHRSDYRDPGGYRFFDRKGAGHQ